MLDAAILSYWNQLPQVAQALLSTIGVGALGEIIGGLTTEKLKQPELALVPFYRRWREGIVKENPNFHQAFQVFFKSERVQAQIQLLLRGQFKLVDFDTLEDEFSGACLSEGCPLPNDSLTDMLLEMLETLDRLHPNRTIVESIEALRNRTPAERNHSLARRAYRAYLLAEFGQQELRGLPVKGARTHIPLEDIFVTPRLQQGKTEIPASQLLTRHRRQHVIIGGPGSGKTTLLRYLTLQSASPDSPVLPIYYRAIRYAKDLEKGGDFWDCLARFLLDQGQLRLPPGFPQNEKLPLAIFLDGLDEVDRATRDQIKTAICHLKLPPGSALVVTSRPAEYADGPLSSQQFEHHELLPFGEDEIPKAIRAWSLAHESSSTATDKAVEELSERILNEEGLKDLAGTPLLLTLMVLVHWNLGRLPDGRLHLLDAVSLCLLDRWHIGKADAPGGLTLKEKRAFLERLAFDLQTKGQLRIDGEQLEEDLSAFLLGLRKEQADAADMVRRFVERDAILAKFDDHGRRERFGFFHRMFQEYFAACHIVRRLNVRKLIEQYRGSDTWQQTLYLAVARMEEQYQQDVLIELLKESEAEFAFECVALTTNNVILEGDWIYRLTRYLAKCTWTGRAAAAMQPSDVLDASARAEIQEIVEAIFQNRQNAEVMAAALELAKALNLPLVDDFLSEFHTKHHGQLDMVTVTSSNGVKFLLDRALVSNADFAQMAPAPSRKGFDHPEQPVVDVNWYAARLFAEWRGNCRLPTADEWHDAAGRDTEYPWGNKFEASKCNTSESKRGTTTPVRKPEHKHGDFFDLSGNVWEWMANKYNEKGEHKELRGGSWYGNRERARSADRGSDHPANRSYGRGFRCARTL